MGSGSALPTKDNFHASQVLELRGRRYMIDCGEGTQIKMGQYKVNVSRLNNIFISHLHSDHCIGLAGLISTMAMLGRSEPLSIYTRLLYRRRIVRGDIPRYKSEIKRNRIRGQSPDSKHHSLETQSTYLRIFIRRTTRRAASDKTDDRGFRYTDTRA